MFLEKILPNYHLDPQGYVAPIQARAVLRAGGVCGRAGVRLLHLTMTMKMWRRRRRIMMMWRRRRRRGGNHDSEKDGHDHYDEEGK